MAKITTYDYNRAENSLTVTYESGTVRRYSVDFTPKSVQTFIMTDIVDSILSEYKQKFLDRKEEIFPLIRYTKEFANGSFSIDYTNEEVSKEVTHLCTKLNFISEFSSLSLIDFVSTLSRYYIALKDDALSEYPSEYYSPRQHESLKIEYNFLNELVERFCIPVDDCSFVFTLKHLLSVAFPDTVQSDDTREQSKPETEESVSEVKECTNCPECIYYEKCASNAPERMQCKSIYPCVVLSCCADFQSRKSIDDIYEEQKKTEPAYELESDLDYGDILEDEELPF